MSQYSDILDWSAAKAEPFSPHYGNGDYWLINDDSISNPDLLLSLPLSLIQEDKNSLERRLKYEGDVVEYILSDTDEELISPQQLLPEGLSPVIKYEDNFDSPIQSPSLSGNNSPNDRALRAQRASKLLDELDGYKEEPLSDWFEEKIDLPIFEEFAPPKEPVQDTQSLLREFESVCGTIGINNGQQFVHLTPPQSPPEAAYQIQNSPGVQYVPQTPALVLSVPADPLSPPQAPDNVFDWHLNVPLEQTYSPDIAKELATVDDIVYRAALNIAWPEKEASFIPVPNVEITGAELITGDGFLRMYENGTDKNGESEMQCDSFSNASCDQSYSMSNEEDSSPAPSSPASSSCSTYGSSENDDDWGRPYTSKSSKSKSSTRAKPYSRNPDDKKSRKKEQNKNAATRYRQKKKAEVEILLEEEKALLDKNTDLRTRHSDLKREVKYLKSLLKELLKSRGVSV